MKEVNYKDSELEEIKNAVESAKANLEMEGYLVSNEEKKQLINQLANNDKIKLLLKKGKKNERRYME